MVVNVEGKVAGVILPTSMNFTAISFEIFRMVSSETVVEMSSVFASCLFEAIMSFPVYGDCQRLCRVKKASSSR